MKNNYFKEILAIRGMGQVISVTAALCVMTLVFGIINPSFFSGENTTNLLRQVVPIMIIGIGQSFVMITGGIDLSIGSVAGMSSMISATLMTKGGMDPWVASGITLAACCLVGLVNGMLVSLTKLPAFIATLGTMIIARGIAQLANGNMNTDGIPESADGFKSIFYYGDTLGLFNPIWIGIILFLIFAFILGKFLCFNLFGFFKCSIFCVFVICKISLNASLNRVACFFFNSLIIGNFKTAEE